MLDPSRFILDGIYQYPILGDRIIKKNDRMNCASEMYREVRKLRLSVQRPYLLVSIAR